MNHEWQRKYRINSPLYEKPIKEDKCINCGVVRIRIFENGCWNGVCKMPNGEFEKTTVICEKKED